MLDFGSCSFNENKCIIDFFFPFLCFEFVNFPFEPLFKGEDISFSSAKQVIKMYF